MAALILLPIIVLLVIDYFAADEFQHIAEMKGHKERKYFWWAFLGGPIGMLMVVALPDRLANGIADAKTSADELPEI